MASMLRLLERDKVEGSRQDSLCPAVFVHERRDSNMDAHNLARSSIYDDMGGHVWSLLSRHETNTYFLR
jgi:hypothetical protein